MKLIDKIIFGDNQFFGINHMSQEKAQQLAEKFYDTTEIIKVYKIAIESGVEAFMLNNNDRAKEICDYFINNKSKYSNMNWYPSIPYPHKYANLISEKGILPTINEILFKDNSAKGILNLIAKGSSALVSKDDIKLLQMLVDVELKTFNKLNVKVIFLQNIITDLLLGFEVKDIFFEYIEYIRKKYRAIPGLITQNLPVLKNKLEQWGIKEIVICSSVNKVGYLMSPDKGTCIEVIKNNNIFEYQIMAMSILASGAIPAHEAIDFIKKQKIQSIVFGASSKSHIEETVNLLKTQ